MGLVPSMLTGVVLPILAAAVAALYKVIARPGTAFRTDDVALAGEILLAGIALQVSFAARPLLAVARREVLEPSITDADPAGLLSNAEGLARIAIYHGVVLGVLGILMLVFAVWIKHGHTGPAGTLALSTAVMSTTSAMVLVMLLPVNNAVSPRVVHWLAPVYE